MPTLSSDRRFSAATTLILLGATLAIYAQTFEFPFVHWDDPAYVTRNPHVLAGLDSESVLWALTDTQEINWHPATWVSHMLDVEIFGENAGGHHATSVLLHFLNALLIFELFRRTTGAAWRSAGVALLFIIHPLHVESVAWVSERKDVLSTFFALLATFAYVVYAEARARDTSSRGARALRYCIVLTFFSLALMAKSMVVTLPAVFLLLDYWPLRRRITARIFVEKLPLLALTVAASLIAVLTQQNAGAMVRSDPIPLWARLANASVSYGRYLTKTAWPTDLSMFYPHPYIPESGGVPLGALEIAASALVVLAVSAWVVLRAEHRWAFVGWFWFAGTLVPVIGLMQVGHQGMADRYMYLPSIGLFVLLVWAAAECGERLRARRPARLLAGLVVCAVFFAIGVAAWKQTTYWRNTEALFEHALEAEPRNPKIRFNIANRLRSEGKLDLAIENYRRALEAYPSALEPNLNLANTLRMQGKLSDAVLIYEHMLEIDPDHQLAHINLGSAYNSLSQIEPAIRHYERAIELGPSATAEFNFANLLRSAGRHRDAIPHYNASLDLDPSQPRAHNNLGISLMAEGQFDAAARHFALALRLLPDHYRAANNLGSALEELGQDEAAIRSYRHALEISRDYGSANRNLGMLLNVRGEFGEARDHLERAFENDPSDVEVRRALDALSDQ